MICEVSYSELLLAFSSSAFSLFFISITPSATQKLYRYVLVNVEFRKGSSHYFDER